MQPWLSSKSKKIIIVDIYNIYYVIKWFKTKRYMTFQNSHYYAYDKYVYQYNFYYNTICVKYTQIHVKSIQHTYDFTLQ